VRELAVIYRFDDDIKSTRKRNQIQSERNGIKRDQTCLLGELGTVPNSSKQLEKRF